MGQCKTGYALKNQIMKTFLKYGLILTVSFLAACSTQASYESMKKAAEHNAKCYQIIDPQEAEQCKEQFDKPYDAYKKEREDTLGK